MVFIKPDYSERHRQIGLKIGYYRKLRGLTQEQLAEKLDMNASYLGAVEAPNIDKPISLDTLFYIADALKTPPHKFLQFDDE